jgi:DNA-binding transcriptional ArsR family regulator
VQPEQAIRMAAVARALGNPVRLQLIDVLRKHAGKVCVCELVPLFDISQPTVSHHLKVLRQAPLAGSERQGLWAYYPPYLYRPKAQMVRPRLLQRVVGLVLGVPESASCP